MNTLVVLFGPLWAPVNPYIAGQHVVSHYDAERGEWIHPPLSPSEEYPLGTDEWGNDILSMLMYGARNTLVACAFITMVRVIMGIILGGYAGWNEGSTSDQFIMALIGVITSVPMLVSSMIIIYALNIRRGLPVFIIALSVIGWTEIAQYIRSEFLVLRKMPFIEGARAVGTRNFGIAVRHVLPNILPQLLVITFLELGAVLMLLGELGFVGVYIGGGSHIALGDEATGIAIVTLTEVPEWGSMLAEGYRWLRAKPFVVLPPAIAFFTAVVGFNAMGEGLRRLIEQFHVNTGFLLRKRMLLVIAALTFATVFIINNTGPAPWFAMVAEAFNGNSAYKHTTTLTEMEGRGFGQTGGEQAAAYIAEKFEAYGLQPGWRHLEYVYPLETRLVRPLSQPELVLLDADGDPLQDFRHQLEFGFVIDGHGGSGIAKYPLTFVGFRSGQGDSDWESFAGLDLRDRIVLLVMGNAPNNFAMEALIRGARGVLWVAGEGQDDVRSQMQLADPEREYVSEPQIPIFRIRPQVAQTIVGQDGLTLTDLLAEDGVTQTGPGWFKRPLNVTVRMSLELGEPQEVEIPSVLGYRLGSDFQLANQMVVLFANYDGLGIDPDGTLFPAANHNASGTGVLLELARLWQEHDLDPRRSVLFVAWGGGQLDDPGAKAFLEDSRSFRHLPALDRGRALSPSVIFQLDYAGNGGDALFIHPTSDNHLQELLESTAADADIPVTEESETQPFSGIARANNAAWIYLAWTNNNFPPDMDRIDQIEVEKLQAYGETLSLALTTIVRQSTY